MSRPTERRPARTAKREHRTPYTDLFREIAPDLDPHGVECHMRIEYGTLDHLPHSTFVEEVQLARHIEAQEPGYLASVKESYGW